MAAEYSPAPQAYYSTKSTFTPLSSGQQTPANVSPTSPRSTVNIPSLHIQPPQVQPRKKPIYVPAALRKTEKPNRQSPPKIDSALNSAHSSWEAGFRKPTDDNALLDANVPRTLTEAELNVEAPLSPVTGPVTRVHWQDDSTTTVCTQPGCKTPFTLFNRRHHCRKCGGIFCAAHSQQQVQLNEHALFHPNGDLQRACDTCYNTFRQWKHLRTSRANSESSGGSSSSSNAVNINAPLQVPAKRPEAQRGSLAQSFQGTWNWSTF